MVKTKYIIFALFLFFFIILTGGCVGGNGNPLELVGDWKYSHSDIGTANEDNSYTDLLTFKGDGSLVAIHQQQNNIPGSPLIEVTFTGNYYGDPLTSPKMISIDIKNVTVKVNGTDYPAGDGITAPSFSSVTGSIGGSYWIESTKPNKLGLKI